MKFFQRRPPPKLSIVVVIYNMGREAPRTLHSLSAAYQRGVGSDDYEVIVVDNGSTPPFGAEAIRRFGDNFHYFYLEPADPSPARAVNFGVERGRGECVGLLVDGARLVTPNVVALSLQALRLHPNPVVSVMGWHLGPDLQNLAIAKGYGPEVEDGLLQGINWPDEDPYRLFEISSLAGSAQAGCFRPIWESNALFLKRAFFQRLGGFDQRFASAGGGLVNPDFYGRSTQDPSSLVINLIGEGCFHQIHGGVSTNVDPEEQMRRFHQIWHEEYRAIRGHDYAPVDVRAKTYHFGPLSPHAMRYIEYSAQQAIHERPPAPCPPPLRRRRLAPGPA